MSYQDIQLEAQSGFIIKRGEFREPVGEPQHYECQICTNEASGNFYGTGFMLCVLCADYVANVYTDMRTGKYATWDIEDPWTARRKAKRKDVITQTLRTQVFERDQYRCINCDSHEKLCADHIYPESKGGATTLENLQTLCQSCNSSKGTKTMGEWVGGVK